MQCLDLLGPLDISEETREELVSHARPAGTLRWSGSEQEVSASAQRVSEMLQLIVSLRDYQYA